MIIQRLKLENWRGVDSLEVQLSDGVTLIEGPNEIGKSTIVEAVRTLFTTLDSSNKKEIKTIQPVGNDVGSHVEAEILTGDYHFIYGKIFNKDKQTYLHVNSPQAEQLTGRDAHDRAEQILNETVDMALWDALLVEQGKEVTGAHLSDSRGLARALDEAAGSASAQLEDTDLYTAAQAEFEKYFTLKTEKPKYSELQRKLSKANDVVEETRNVLAATESDAEEHERCLSEIRRLNTAEPGLREKVEQHESEWQAIDALQRNSEAKKAAVESARLALKAALKEKSQRDDLAEEVDSSLRNLSGKRDELAPLAKKLTKLGEQKEEAETEHGEAKKSLKSARTTLELARADQRYIEQVDALGAALQRLKQLEALKKKAAKARSTLSEIKVDSHGVSDLRDAERQVQIAKAKRDALASNIEISAESELKFSWGEGEQFGLAKGDVEQRNVAAETVLNIQDVASIRFTPSQSAAAVEGELKQCKETLSNLLDRYKVKNLADAVAAEGRRLDAERDLKSLNENMRELLVDDSEEDIDASVETLQAECESYLTARRSEINVPDDIASAASQLSEAEEASSNAEDQAEQKREAFDTLKDNYNEASADNRVGAQEIDGLEADLQRRQTKLEELRLIDADEVVAARVTEHNSKVELLEAELLASTAQFNAAMPEAAELILTNSRDSLDRAEKDLIERHKHLAVLEDRLSNAQANGRFEELEIEERELEDLQANYDSTKSRAEAISLLWKTLNKHRDATRQAYLLPLKNHVERLGKVVFGSGFSVEVGEDWTLVSRTLNGKTIPFDDLSVGAKEQLGILTRLAAAQIVSGDGGVPLIIDDALGFSDPARLELMGAAISSAGKDCQIILLTCTPGRFQNVGSAQVVRIETELSSAT